MSDPAAGVRAELATAVMFLTRLPVFGLGSGDPLVLSRSTRWFPLVGVLTGGAVSATFALAALVLPASIAIVAALVAGVLVTGAFHEDGLADVADSAGAFGRDAKLEIMRDSRVGTYGALALILLVLAKFVVLSELASDVSALAVALIGAHVLARWSSVFLMARVPYSQAGARAGAGNRVVAEGVSGRSLLHGSLCAAVLLLALAATIDSALALVIAAVLTIAVTALAGARVRHTLGGITGDVLGAVNQIVEVVVLCAFVAMSG